MNSWEVRIGNFEYQSTTMYFTDEQRAYINQYDCLIIHTGPRNGTFQKNKWVYDQHDMLDYFTNEQLDLLEKGAPVFVDNRQEGHSHYEVDFYSDIYYTIKKHGLDTKQFWYISSNLKEEESHRRFLIENPSFYQNKNKINLLTLNDLNNVIVNFQQPFDRPYVEQKTVEKSFLCMNHRPAAHRIQLLFYLFKNKTLKNIYASCYKPTKHAYMGVMGDYLRSEPEDIRVAFYNSLPYYLDVKFFYNYTTPLFDSLPMEFFDKSAAALVTESLSNDWNNTSLFYSEKTWKPMWFGLPVLIVGQIEANLYLEKLGFELYTEIFDYDFDSEKDQTKRLKMIAEQVKYINKSQSWKTWNKICIEKIMHNRHNLEKNTYNKKSCQKFFQVFSKLNK